MQTSRASRRQLTILMFLSASCFVKSFVIYVWMRCIKTFVSRFVASDLDYGVNAQLKYFFKSAFRTDLFSIDEDSGEIFVKGELDYEHVKTHVLIVGIKDSSLIPLESTMYVVVDVDDVNEWKPAFLKSSYEVSIQDTIPRGSDVIKVIAQDKDQGLNGVLKYCITSGNVDYAFFIRPQSGVIQTNKVLSASDITEYKLTVEARDHGTFGLSSSVNITVSGWGVLTRRTTRLLFLVFKSFFYTE